MDPTRTERLRGRLVAELRRAGSLRQPAVARAIATVPRHMFVPEVSPRDAYADRVIVTKRGPGGTTLSSASQPSIVALMLQQLDVRPGHRVLEIGAGTGYNAALLAALVGPEGSVTTVDIDDESVARASGALAETGFDNVVVRQADGGYGFPAGAPYDRLVVTAGAWDITPAWWDQLAPGGILVLPLSVRGVTVSIAFQCGADGHLQSRSVIGCGFLPLRGVSAAHGRWIEVGAGSGMWLAVDDDRPLDVDALVTAIRQASAAFSADADMDADADSDEPADLSDADPDGADTIGSGEEPSDTGVVAPCATLWTDMELWLASADPAFCRLELSPEAVRRRRIRDPLRFFTGDGRSAALAERDSIALVEYRPTDPPLRDSEEPWRLEDPTTRCSLAVAGYGPRGELLAKRLTDHLRRWLDAGPASVDRVRVCAFRAAGPVPPDLPEGALLVDKAHTRLAVAWT